MDRNKPCFCGSGVKQKYCHPDIESNSIFGFVAKLYQKIDQAFEASSNPSNCHKGCAECCSHTFIVSQAEFLYTLYGASIMNIDIETILEKGNSSFRSVAEKNPELIKRFEDFSGIAGFKEYSNFMREIYLQSVNVFEPCVFLDKTDNSCMIYKYRPIVCRYHGKGILDLYSEMSTHLLLCGKNTKGILLDNLINLSDYAEDILQLSIYSIPTPPVTMFDVNFPIFYFCKIFFNKEDNYQSKIEDMKYNSFSQYAQKMYRRNIHKSSS